MAKSDLLETKQIIYNSNSFDQIYPKIYFLLNLSHCPKRYGHFSQIWALFTMHTHQIWSCYMTQVAISKFLISLSQFSTFMHQSIPSLTIPPPPGNFFDGRIPHPRAKRSSKLPPPGL